MSKFQAEEWANLMLGYETDFEQGDKIETEITSLVHKLNRVLEKKSAILWHTKTFDRYIKENINPLGLRVQIFPNSDQISHGCKKEWIENLKLCSQEMMVVLTREYNKQMQRSVTWNLPLCLMHNMPCV